MGSHEVLRDDAGVTLRLAGAWTVENAAELRRELLALGASEGDLRLSLDGVEAGDATLFELVHAACVSAARDAKRLIRIGSLSDTVRQAVALSGFSENGPFADFWKEEERHVQDDHDRG